MNKFISILAVITVAFLLSACSQKPEPSEPVAHTDGTGMVDMEFSMAMSPSTVTGCTHTIGYWKNHSEFGPAKYDSAWAKVRHGASTPFAGTGKTYIEIARMSSSSGNAYIILARQFIAAKLNLHSGASMPREVFAAGTHAIELLRNYDGNPYPMTAIKKEIRQDFLNTATILANYNEGLIGPGHCDDDSDNQPVGGNDKNGERSR